MKDKTIGQFRNQDGSIIVLVAIALTMLLGFAALALDIGHLAVVKNQLQNAADSGALAGTEALYNTDGTVNAGAAQVAINAATANTSENVAVEVQTSDVQRGHWSFTTNTFTPIPSPSQPSISGVTFQQIDTDTSFLNAVQVTARREATPASSFFARIFGLQSFVESATAVAYVGFPGTLPPHSVFEPIAICQQTFMTNGTYACPAVGRLMAAGANTNTGGWTDFIQPCGGAASASSLSALVCGTGNSAGLSYGESMTTTQGAQGSTFQQMVNCWLSNSANGTQPWNLTLPVIDCPGNNVGNCSNMLGAVNIDIIWMMFQAKPDYSNAPTQMGAVNGKAPWSNNSTDGFTRWASFVQYYNIQDATGNTDPTYLWQTQSIYFIPTCPPYSFQPTGQTGGGVSNLLSRIPVLVQ